MALRQDTRTATGPSPAGERDPEIIHDARGTGVTPLLIGAGILATLFVIFLAQSNDDVPVEFLVWEGTAPLFVLLLATMAATALLTLAVAGLWRRRRRRARVEREELARLRRRA